ncbi:hypothetical protein GQX73_g6734 [Xylaria multiplex]|uniref:C2H2-type domain-containing protein n=1 Tax=Xylaria multiplex TaxID=323545 RepID=A0A7C8MQ98_9PEZI|nr:hypothetical protein GQX73_g6734 [Xylaria multiplex]
MARRPEPETWQRWPPHHQAWPALPPTFVIEQSYTMTPLIPMSAPQYPVHHGFVYDTYSAPEATNSIVASTKQYLAERALLPVSNHGLAESLQETSHLPAKQSSLSPVIKSESQPPESLKDPQAITANTADSQSSNAVFATGDAPTTQSKSKTRANNSSTEGTVARKRSKANTSNVELKDKPHACHRKKCHKRFSQITHLHIHDRAHTGERPHKCTFAGCDKRFTQKGNLRTHERRHLGERPFKCHFVGCTRAFPQKGNLAAHLETHYKRNTFRCILKSCGKSFSSRGNLKTHQNNYHKEELRELELKFANMRSVAEMTEADRELWDYFLTVHKNSNKGIKGRGKECRVELLPHSGNLPNQYPLQSAVELPHTPFPMSHGLPNSINFGHYGMQRPNPGQEFLVARGGHGFEVYEIDQASISSGTITPASSPGGMYDDHHRGLPFHDRMY